MFPINTMSSMSSTARQKVFGNSLRGKTKSPKTTPELFVSTKIEDIQEKSCSLHDFVIYFCSATNVHSERLVIISNICRCKCRHIMHECFNKVQAWIIYLYISLCCNWEEEAAVLSFNIHLTYMYTSHQQQAAAMVWWSVCMFALVQSQKDAHVRARNFQSCYFHTISLIHKW